MNNRIRLWLVQLYPTSWRSRYEAEFSALLEECMNSPLVVLDVVMGAIDAHLHLVKEDNPNWRMINMGNITRKKEVIVAAIMAISTTAVVALAKNVGADIVGAFIAGAGAAVTVGYVIITNNMIKQARKK
jgi:hypothetical protein